MKYKKSGQGPTLPEIAAEHGFEFATAKQGGWVVKDLKSGVVYGCGINRRSALEQALCRTVAPSEGR